MIYEITQPVVNKCALTLYVVLTPTTQRKLPTEADCEHIGLGS